MKLILLFLFILIINGCTNQILYQPSEATHSISNYYDYKEKIITTKDGEKLSAIEYHTSQKNKKGVILILYGNADNINNISSISLGFVPEGYDVFFFDYRGYGKSTGSPSTKGLNLDIQASVEYLSENFENIYIYAQSIGGVSLLGALGNINKNKIRAIATEGAFLSYSELSKEFLGILLPWVNYDELNSYAPITSNRDITIPLLLIHSEEDELISYKHGQALAKHFKHAQHLKINGNHLGYLSTKKRFKDLVRFFEKHESYQWECK